MAFCPVRAYYHRYNPASITGNINRTKESIAYRTIVRDLSNNIDPFLSGCQKELILNNLITALQNHYYIDEDTRKDLIASFEKCNKKIEKILLRMFVFTKNSKILHLLLRMYKRKD